MTNHLIADNLSYYTRHTCLLKQVDCCWQAGQLNMLTGNNGAGKTTLLRLLAGFIKPHSGSISISDDNLANFSLKELARRRAVLPQHDSLNTIFSVSEIIDFAALPFSYKSMRKSMDKLKKKITEALEIKHLQNRFYHTLSGGEKQRVRLARVILQARLSQQKTAWLMLDEPLNSLDWGHQHKLLDYLRQLASKGLGILIVLHDLNLVLQYADEVCLLHNGQVFASGSSADVLSKDNIKQVFKV